MEFGRHALQKLAHHHAFQKAYACWLASSWRPAIPDLLQEQLDGYPHRSMAADRDAAPVARVWLLADDATPDAIPSVLMIEAVRLVLAGKGVLMLAQRPEPEVDVRDGLLQALDLFTIPRDGARHA